MSAETDEAPGFPAEEGNHIAGRYFEGVQRCVVCGGVLVDNRGAMVPAGSRPPCGFAEGPVHRIENMTSVGHDDNLSNCSPL